MERKDQEVSEIRAQTHGMVEENNNLKEKIEKLEKTCKCVCFINMCIENLLSNLKLIIGNLSLICRVSIIDIPSFEFGTVHSLFYGFLSQILKLSIHIEPN
jgi:hypothetical protein